jgi:hypothetical protein
LLLSLHRGEFPSQEYFIRVSFYCQLADIEQIALSFLTLFHKQGMQQKISYVIHPKNDDLDHGVVLYLERILISQQQS